MKNELTLNVGCGNKPTEYINTDLYIKDIFNHRNKDNDELKIKSSDNFIQCDAKYLPFKNNIFSKVYCSQMIEHDKEPQLVFKELVRVCSNILIIETIHRYGEMFDFHSKKWYKEHHFSKFNVKWFKEISKIYNIKFIKSYVVNEVYFPSWNFRILTFPYIFGVEFKK